MINVQQVLPILHRSMPKASVQELLGAINKFQKVHPNITSEQFLALIQETMKQKQNVPSAEDEEAVMNNLAGGK